MPDKSVRARSDEGVARSKRKFEGEELAKGTIACDTENRSKDKEDEACKICGCDEHGFMSPEVCGDRVKGESFS